MIWIWLSITVVACALTCLFAVALSGSISRTEPWQDDEQAAFLRAHRVERELREAEAAFERRARRTARARLLRRVWRRLTLRRDRRAPLDATGAGFEEHA